MDLGPGGGPGLDVRSLEGLALRSLLLSRGRAVGGGESLQPHHPQPLQSDRGADPEHPEPEQSEHEERHQHGDQPAAPAAGHRAVSEIECLESVQTITVNQSLAVVFPPKIDVYLPKIEI